MSGPIFSHHAPGTVSGEGDTTFHGSFAIGEKHFDFVANLRRPVPAFQVPHAFLNYNDIMEVVDADFGPDARVGPYDIYTSYVNGSGQIVGTVTGKLASYVAETPVSGTLTLSSSSS